MEHITQNIQCKTIFKITENKKGAGQVPLSDRTPIFYVLFISYIIKPVKRF